MTDNELALKTRVCLKCGVGLPSDRLEVADEEEASGSKQLAARLRSGRCIACSDPTGGPIGKPRTSGDASRSPGQRHGWKKLRS